MAAIEGTTIDCLKHYLSQLSWGTKMCVQARQPLIDFVGVTPNTIRRWWTEGGAPLGLVLVKLRYFLEKEGYRVSELDNLEPTTRKLGELIAFGTIDFEATSSQLKYPCGSHFLRALHGGRRLSSAQIIIAKGICSQVREALMMLDVSMAESPDVPAKMTLAAVPVRTEEKNTKAGEELIKSLRLLDGILDLLVPRLKDFLSETVSPEERHELRERAGRELVYDLARRNIQVTELLKALCSEKAREISITR